MMRLSILFGLVLCFGCKTSVKEDLAGLWQLDKVHFLHFERKFEPVILSIDENGSFAVSQATKDFIGIYKIHADTLIFSSGDESWFNEKWIVKVKDGKMVLMGTDHHLSTTSLLFTSLQKIPDLNVVEEKLIGSWDLYEIKGNGRATRALSDTLLHIAEDGHYFISDELGILEQGEMYINSRHRNIVFENTNKIWDVLLLGDELRLTDEQTGLQYSLRERRYD